MPLDTKHHDLQSLRIDRSAKSGEGEPAPWAKRYIIIGISIVVLLSLSALMYRLLAADAPEVEVARAAAENSDLGGIVLSATGYIVAHHKINLNSKVTGRVKWIGVEKGDKVKEGQVLVRLEDDEFRAQYQQAHGAAENARAYYQELQHGSRPEEIQQAEHNLAEARATLANDKIVLDRTRNLTNQGVLSQQALDDATAKFDADLHDIQVELDIAQDDFAKLGPRQKGAVTVDAFPDRKYDGVIAEISPQANRQKATVQVKVQILNPDEYLRPEMNSTVKFLADEGKKGGSQPSGVFVPTTALRDRDGKKVVFIAFNGKALMRQVRVISQRSGGLLVQGLNGGEDVITSGPQDLKDGNKIKIKGQS